jgi:hypothetical protein
MEPVAPGVKATVSEYNHCRPLLIRALGGLHSSGHTGGKMQGTHFTLEEAFTKRVLCHVRKGYFQVRMSVIFLWRTSAYSAFLYDDHELMHSGYRNVGLLFISLQ